jgi:hypothetical protein
MEEMIAMKTAWNIIEGMLMVLLKPFHSHYRIFGNCQCWSHIKESVSIVLVFEQAIHL